MNLDTALYPASVSVRSRLTEIVQLVKELLHRARKSVTPSVVQIIVLGRRESGSSS